MRGDAPTAETVARQMGMSLRSFLRRLHGEGVTYQDVLDGVRRDLAEALLRDGGIKLTELAFLLGFSEVSAFYRAFRRWTGSTPGEYRQQLVARPSPAS
jgi:AraC-like DNA-binding protein